MSEEKSDQVVENLAYQDPIPPSGIKSMPVQQAERDVAIDVLRGVALLGILAMNIRAFASIFASYANPMVYVDGTGIHRVIWLAGHILFDLKMMAIFSMLFGAGIVLMASRLKAKGQKSLGVHYRRMAWLLVIGLLHAHLIWNGDILVMYALIGMIVYVAWRWYVPVQIGLGLFLLLLGVGVNFGAGLTLEHWPEADVENMRHMWAPTPEMIETELTTFRGSWLEQLPVRSSFALMFETGGIIFFGLWRVGGLMLLGMGLYRLGIFSAKRSNRFYLAMLILGLAIGVPIILVGYQRNVENGFAMETAMFLTSQFNYVGSLFVAMSWIGAIMLLIKSGTLRWLIGALTAVGQMAFTNYLMQSIICTTIFYGHGLGLFGKYNYLEQFYFVIGVWIVQLIWSPLWLKHFRYGPFEWLWRSLTYWKRQPLKR
ncbi:MAG: DUF418 domain-containing protein [Planctomycetota bacterium]|nr:DUF418 domain-containing protein [Planctomycetota bacterium]